MQYQQYAIEMELTGISRKQAAETISAVFDKPFAYDNSQNIYTIKDDFARDWKIEKADGITNQKYAGDRIIGANYMYAVKISSPLLYQQDFEEVSAILDRLRDSGAITNDTTKLSINIKGKPHAEKSLQNLANLMESKGELIFKAIQSKNQRQPALTTVNGEPVIRFAMFNSSLSADRVQSCVQLASAINHLSIKQNSISPKANDSPNEKFTFRTWLIRLGMVGAEYKNTRAILLKNLVGNTAWKNPEMAPRLRSSAPEPEALIQTELQKGMVFGSM
jgi:hypothetical protein